MTTVWYIRHGESKANAGMATDTPESIELTDLGYEQAKRVSLAIEKEPQLIVTSSYARALQTAQATKKRFPNAPIETWEIQELYHPKNLG